MKTLVQFLALVAMLTAFTSEAQGKITYKTSDTFGGNGGQPFILPKGMAQNYVSQINYIRKISLKVSHRIEKVQVTWAQHDGQDLVQAAGENGGKWKHIYFSKGEFITKVTGNNGRFINQLTFYTSSGKKYGPYGGYEGTPFQIVVPRGHEVIGFYGNSGQCVDKIGLVYQVDIDRNNMRKRPLTRHRQGHSFSNSSRKPDTPTVRPSSVTPRPASNRQATPNNLRKNARDHRKPTKGSSESQEARSNTYDHRKDQDAARRKWMKDNNLDPNRAGG